MQSIGQLKLAIKTLKKQAAISFIDKQKITNLLSENIKSQLKSHMTGGDVDMTVGVFETLLSNMKRNQNKADQQEEMEQAMFERLTGGKKRQLAAVSGAATRKTALLKEAQKNMGNAQNDIAKFEKMVSDTTSALADTNENYKRQTEEYELLAKDKTEEAQSITEALSTLAKEAKNVKAPAKKAAVAPVKKADSKLIQEMVAFIQTGSSDQSKKSTDFTDVKKSINKLVKTLKTEIIEARDRAKTCEAEKKKNQSNVKDKTDDLEQQDAVVAKKTDLVKSLAAKIKETESLVSEMKNSESDLTKLREKAAAAYAQGAKQRNMSLEVLRKARSILAKKFGKGAFVSTLVKTALIQSGTTVRSTSSTKDVSKHMSADSKKLLAMSSFVQVESNSSSKKVEAKIARGPNKMDHPVLVLLDRIIHDIEKEEKDASATEKAETVAFAKEVGDLRTQQDEKFEELRVVAARHAKEQVLHKSRFLVFQTDYYNVPKLVCVFSIAFTLS